VVVMVVSEHAGMLRDVSIVVRRRAIDRRAILDVALSMKIEY